jgi:hypothetical protein
LTAKKDSATVKARFGRDHAPVATGPKNPGPEIGLLMMENPTAAWPSPVMKKFSPYIKTAVTVLIILCVWKIVVQPFIPASLTKYTPTV